MKKKILVPVDFSDCSNNALKNAVQIAKRMNLGLIMIHSYMMPVAHLTVSGSLLTHSLSSYKEKECINKFEKLINELPSLKEIDNNYSIDHGDLNSIIGEMVEKENIEMIIMGTHGANGIGELIMGSNTYSVIKESKVPVMVIPENSSPIRLERLAFLSGYHKIDNPNIIKPLLKLMMKFRAEVDIIHFGKKDELSEEETHRANSLKLHFDKIRHSYHVSSFAEIESAIHDYVLLHNIDLLVMIPSKHNFFDLLFGKEAWSKKMIFHTKTPLFVLPS